LAFLTALQLLPPRQRAILILADVLDWHASEVAQLLELSVSAVNSALHRAQATLEKNYHVEKQERVWQINTDEATHALLARYLHAWETDDIDGFVALLKEDATLSMPPIPAWYWSREAIRAFLPTTVFRPGVQKRWRLCPTRANAQPAFILYRANETTHTYQAFGIQVIALAGSQVAGVTAFLDSRLATAFGFPLQLPD
jgi:RNA polymerase sigma-70 factor (ECF subfamily)